MPDPNQTDPNNQTPVDASQPVGIPPVPSITPDPTASTQPTPTPTEPTSFFSTDDTPPVPDFQAVASAPETVVPPVTDSPVETPVDNSSGSAAPADFPPMTSSPKKKFGGGKVIATILGLFVLVGGVGAGIFLTQQQQILAPKAVGAGECACKNNNTGATVPGECVSPTSCSCPPGTNPGTNKCAEGNGGGGTTLPKCSNITDECSNLGAKQCQGGPNNNTGYECTCIDTSPGNCTRYQWSCGAVNTQQCPIADTGGSIVSYCDNNHCDVGAKFPGCYVNHYSSDNKDDPVVNDKTIKSAVKSASLGAVSCGAEQIDVFCDGGTANTISRRYPTSCGVSTPGPTATPGGPTAQCQNVKAYSSTWAPLTTAQLSALTPGTSINFCVVGSASAGSFDRGKFTINGVAQAETTTQRPGTQDFCQSYTIPPATNAFNVTAQIHHVTLGWK